MRVSDERPWPGTQIQATLNTMLPHDSLMSLLCPEQNNDRNQGSFQTHRWEHQEELPEWGKAVTGFRYRTTC